VTPTETLVTWTSVEASTGSEDVLYEFSTFGFTITVPTTSANADQFVTDSVFTDFIIATDTLSSQSCTVWNDA